jgi:hypothetical protein
MSPVRSAVFAALLSAPVIHAQSVNPLNFETAGQLSSNFRPILNGTTASEGSDGTNGFVQVLGGTNTTPWIGIYDTTPGDAGDPAQTFSGPFTLRIDISGANTNSSFGLFLFDSANQANNLLTIFNIDNNTVAAGNEQIRFWRDTSMVSSAVTNAYTTSAFTGTNGTADAGTNSWITTAAIRGNEVIDTTSPFTFYTLDFTYDPGASTLQVSTGSFSATLTVPAADLIANPAVAVRINDAVVDASNTAKFDNFAVVPEPGSITLLGLSALGMMTVRRRQAV